MHKNNFSEDIKQSEISLKTSQETKKGSIIDKLNVSPNDQSSFLLKIAGGIFIAHWFIGAIAGLFYEHFAPMENEYPQFFCILCSSLFTFAVSIISFIELSKSKRTGASITLTLVWVNVFVQLLVMYYAKFWLILFNNLFFAVIITIMLKGTQSKIKSAFCVFLLLLNFFFYLTPSVLYAYQRARAPKLMQQVNAIRGEILKTAKPIENQTLNRYTERPELKESKKYQELLSKTEKSYNQLVFISDFIGEKRKNRAIYQSNWAMALALQGKYKFAYEMATNSVSFAYVEDAHVNKAKIFAILHNISYKPYITKVLSEKDEQLIEQQRLDDKYENEIEDPSEDNDDDIDLNEWLDDDED